MADIAIQRATLADASRIAAVDIACGAPQHALRSALVPELLKLGMSWIAEAGADAAGYALVSRRFFSRPFVESLAVVPARRRGGLGMALMASCERDHPDDRLFTSTNQSNAAMQALMAKAGYKASGIILNLDPGDPELVFVKFRNRA